jgi:hypothetical protein
MEMLQDFHQKQVLLFEYLLHLNLIFLLLNFHPLPILIHYILLLFDLSEYYHQTLNLLFECLLLLKLCLAVIIKAHHLTTLQTTTLLKVPEVLLYQICPSASALSGSVAKNFTGFPNIFL